MLHLLIAAYGSGTHQLCCRRGGDELEGDVIQGASVFHDAPVLYRRATRKRSVASGSLGSENGDTSSIRQQAGSGAIGRPE
jgi:hypothetical protein